MRGHIRKRGETWSAVVYVGKDPKTGKAKYKWDGGHRTRREAQRALTELLARLHKGNHVAPTRITVGEYLREWLPAIKRELRPSTVPGYEIAVEEHLIRHLGELPLQKLAPHQLNAMYAELLQSGRRQGRGGLSPSTVRSIHRVLSRALNDAVEQRLLETNPASRAKPPKANVVEAQARKARRFLDADQVRTFLLSVQEHRLRAAFHLAATTGMRRGRCLAHAGRTLISRRGGWWWSRRCSRLDTS